MKGGKYEQWIEALVVVAFDIYEGIILNNELGVIILENGYRVYFIYKYIEKEIFVFDDEDCDSLE